SGSSARSSTRPPGCKKTPRASSTRRSAQRRRKPHGAWPASSSGRSPRSPPKGSARCARRQNESAPSLAVNPSLRPPTRRCRVGLRHHEAKGAMQMTQTAETPDERVKVESWRLHVLVEAGYPIPLAERIAHSNADLHQAVGLVRSGCAPDLAAEIIL